MRGGSAATVLAAIILTLAACAPLEPRRAPDDRETTAQAPAEDKHDREPDRLEAPDEPSAPAPTASDQAEAADPETEVTPLPEPGAASGEDDETEASGASSADEPSKPETVEKRTPRPPTQPDQAPEKEETTQARAPASDRQRSELKGRIRLEGGDADVDEAVVYFVADSIEGSGAEAAPSEPAEIVTHDKSLSPTVLTVSRGTEVRFPNDDPILHNLFSVSSNNEFDLGIYGPGEAPSVRFEQPGAVNIYCNVHHDMHAHVLVIDTPWHTRAGADGRFSLTDLPAGEGELRVWHRQSETWSRPIRLPVDEPIEVSLEVTKPRLPQHRDKAGQPYNRRDRDPYR